MSLYLLLGTAAAIIFFCFYQAFVTTNQNLFLPSYLRNYSTKNKVYNQIKENLLEIYAVFEFHIHFLLCVIAVIAVTYVPIAVLRLSDENHEHSTHWNTYTWVVSFAYMDGDEMGILAIVVWTAAILSLFAYVFFYVRNMHQDFNATCPTVTNVSEKSTGYFKIISAFVICVGVTVAANVLYLLSITELSLSPASSFVIRVSVSIFRIAYSVVLVPFLADFAKDIVKKTLIMFQLLLLGNIFIPCVVNAFTSPNCFEVTRCT